MFERKGDVVVDGNLDHPLTNLVAGVAGRVVGRRDGALRLHKGASANACGGYRNTVKVRM